MRTGGSNEAIARVESGELDYALVLGGRDFSRYANVRQVAALHVEPMQLLVKSEHAEAVAKHLGDLRGKVVHLGGGPESATYNLARELLTLVGLGPGDYEARTEGPGAAVGAGDSARLPDALFITAAPPLTFVRRGRARLPDHPVPVP